MSEVTTLQLSLLGSPHISVNSRPLNVDRHKAVALLAYLAVTGERHQRQTLATLFWPDHDETRAPANLRHVLWVLKKEIGPHWLEIDRSTVRLRPGFGLDIHAFHEKMNRAQTIMAEMNSPSGQDRALALFDEAAALYRDTFLAGFTLRDTPDFDAWQLFQAQHYRQQLETILQFLIDGYCRRQRWKSAIQYGQRWLSLDPLHEPAHVQLMQLYVQAGKKAAALRQYEACQHILAAELGTTPQTETADLYRRIQSGALDTSSSWTEWAGPRPDTNGAVNRLSAPLTPFFGRQEELKAISKRLENPFCRLLTIMGPGGIGKTRLAIQMAYQQSAAFAHGVCFVPLAPVSSVTFLVPTIADALNLTFSQGKDHKAQLLTYLRQKEMLLVMDNFEHLVDGAGLLLEILEWAPAVRILVTSRARLNFQVEWLYTIQGLPFPVQADDGIERYSAVELFLHHALRVCHTFDFSLAEKTAVLRICQLLEGMPLGIELAAALRGTYSSADIADEIQRNLDFLTTSMRDLPERHRSLRAIFEHSWSLLSDAEKQVLEQLSIFRGGFRLEAAVYIARANSSLLTTLVNKSFLRQTPSGRYEIHERLRQFAAEKLDDNGQTKSELQDRFGDYYANFLQQKETILSSKGQKEALEAIREEIENIRAAWRWLVQQQKSKPIQQMLRSLLLFYDLNGWTQEARDLFAWAANRWEDAAVDAEAHPDNQFTLACLRVYQAAFENRLSRYETAVPVLQKYLAFFRSPRRAREMAFTLTQLGTGLYYLGKYPESEQAFEESLSASREIDDLLSQGAALAGLGNIYRALGKFDKARDHMQAALNLWQDLGNRRGMAVALTNLGSLAEGLADYATAKRLLQESLIIKQEFGERRGIAISWLNLGFVLIRMKEYEEAAQLLKNSLAAFREMDDLGGVAVSLTNLGNIAYVQGSIAEAKAHYEESLRIAEKVGDRRWIVFSLNDLGNVNYDLKAYAASERYFCRALQLALEMQSLPQLMESLVGMALFLSLQEAFAEAILLLTFVLAQQATEMEAREKGERVLADLLPQVSADVRVMAQEKGKTADLNAIQQLLQEAELCAGIRVNKNALN